MQTVRGGMRFMGFRSAVGGTVWAQDTEPLSCNTPDLPVALSTKCTKPVQGGTQGYHPKSKTVKKVSKTKKKGSEPKDSKPQNGATGRTRTGDLLITNQLLYRLSHSSDSQALFYLIFRRMSSKFFSVTVKNSKHAPSKTALGTTEPYGFSTLRSGCPD